MKKWIELYCDATLGLRYISADCFMLGPLGDRARLNHLLLRVIPPEKFRTERAGPTWPGRVTWSHGYDAVVMGHLADEIGCVLNAPRALVASLFRDTVVTSTTSTSTTLTTNTALNSFLGRQGTVALPAPIIEYRQCSDFTCLSPNHLISRDLRFVVENPSFFS